MCSLLSYNSIVLLFAGYLHVYRYESSSYCFICLQTAHIQFVAFCIHAYIYNMKLPIRSSSTCNSKIAPKLLLLKICWMLARKQDSFNPEEVQHAQVSTYVLYREAISWSYQRKIRANRTLFLCLIQRCSLPHSSPVVQFQYTQPIGEPSRDE